MRRGDAWAGVCMKVLITSDGGSVGGWFSVTTNTELLLKNAEHLQAPQSDRFPGKGMRKS